MRKVEVDDQARALVRFASGATGSLEASWVAAGRKMTLAFEVTGSKGTIVVDHERLNELQLYTVGQAPGREGFKTILAGPDHAFYKEFCPAPGHQLGFNDIKTIEVRALVTRARRRPDLHARLPRSLRDPARRRRHRPLGQGAALAEGGGGVGWAIAKRAHARRWSRVGTARTAPCHRSFARGAPMNKTIAKLGRRLRLGVIGGGPGSFIGPVHRTAARLDDNYEVVASVLSSDPERSRAAGRAIGLARRSRLWQRRTRCSTAKARAPTAWRSSPS